jgi:hypothetical protein
MYMPAMFLFWIGPALQYNVGNDYFTYVNVYENSADLYFRKKEYGFYYLIIFLKKFDFGAQSLFATMSAINTVLLFSSLFFFKKYRFKTWVIFFLFFVVTGLYHNQMNTLRQFIGVFSVPLLSFFLYEKRYIQAALISVFSLAFHSAFAVVILFYFLLIFFRNISKKQLFAIFLLLPFVFLFFVPILQDTIVIYLFNEYSFYMNDSREVKLVTILSKIYYMPLFIYFWYLFLKNKINLSIDPNLVHFLVVIFSTSYCMYLLDFSIPMHGGRIAQYFQFFYIVPIYFVLVHSMRNKNPLILVFIFLMLLSPYIAKVLLFPTGEYEYQTVLFQ